MASCPSDSDLTINNPTSTRRNFLVQAAGLAGERFLVSVAVSAGIAAATEQSKPAAASIPYQSPSPDEATFVASLANITYPADR